MVVTSRVKFGSFTIVSAAGISSSVTARTCIYVFTRSSYLGCGFLSQYGYGLGGEAGEESVYNPEAWNAAVTDHERMHELRITIKVCCNITSDAAVRPLLSPHHHVAAALFILSLRLRWDSQDGASPCLRRFHQSRAH